MPRPSKPFSVIEGEKRSHRTKKELSQRKQGEEALLTGVALKESPETKNNPIAHKEFLRILKLLKNIHKNDAIYESIINRYCIIFAECQDMEREREETYKLILELKATFYETTQDMLPDERADRLIEFSREMARMAAVIMNYDKLIMQKRKMLLDIEKENVMTIAAALRSIPKQTTEEENPLLKALRDG